MVTPALGIDVSKDRLDVEIAACGKPRSKYFANSLDGWRQLLAWLKELKIKRVHACLEATGRYSLGIALALWEAGHTVSIVNPAQIRDFARTKLGRNKTDAVDAGHIREYGEIFKPQPWTPPSPAMRRLGELQTIRAGIVSSLTEWKNRCGSGLADDTALALAKATVTHFAAQLAEVDEAIAGTIDNDHDLSAKRGISGVGEVLAGLVLSELPGTDIVRSSTQAVAYVGLPPRSHRSGSSIDRPTRISKIGNATPRNALYMPALSAMQHNPVVAALAKRLKAHGRLKGKQIAVAAMRKLLVLCFGVLKSGKPFDPALAMPN
jgi:transposase